VGFGDTGYGNETSTTDVPPVREDANPGEARSTESAPEQACGSEGRPPREEARRWADLMRRTFGIDVLACPRCGGRFRLIALIEEASVIERILHHLHLPTEPADGLRSHPLSFQLVRKSPGRSLGRRARLRRRRRGDRGGVSPARESGLRLRERTRPSAREAAGSMPPDRTPW